MRCGHRSPAEIVIVPTDNGGEYVDTGRSQVHLRGAEIGEAGKGISVVRSRHGDYVWSVVVCRIKGRCIVIGAVISGSGDKQHVVGVGFVDLVQQGLRKTASAPA